MVRVRALILVQIRIISIVALMLGVSFGALAVNDVRPLGGPKRYPREANPRRLQATPGAQGS